MEEMGGRIRRVVVRANVERTRIRSANITSDKVETSMEVSEVWHPLQGKIVFGFEGGKSQRVDGGLEVQVQGT